MTKKAVVYLRVSTQRQVEDGISLDAQLSRARSWCESMGYDVIRECRDEGVSGKRADNRPGLQKALAVTTKHKAALVVYSLSRLARSTKDALTIAECLEKANADLVSLSENIDTTSAAGKMVFRMLAVLSEFERDLVSERTTAALAHKRAQGLKTGGSLPFGYDVDKAGRLVDNHDEQATIALMRELRSQRYTLWGIAEELDSRSITTKMGRSWKAKTVKKVLDREAVGRMSQVAACS